MDMLLLFVSTWVHSVLSDELVLAQIVFRHGDRAPMAGSTSLESENYFFRGKQQLTDVKTIQKAPQNADQRKIKFGNEESGRQKLTLSTVHLHRLPSRSKNKGLQQAYQLGLSLRRRYVDSGFLDGRYLPSQVVFRSSSTERTLMTASAAASAMFNLTEYGQSIAVPIFTVPKDEDYVCVPRLECPFVLREMAERLGISNTSPSMNELLLEAFKQESVRLNYTRVTADRLQLFEPLFHEHDAGLAVPQWFDDTAIRETDHLLDLTIEFMSGTGAFHNPKWIQTRSGKLLSTISENQNKAVKQAIGSFKFFAFSTHDAVISALLDSLGVLKEALAPQGRPDFTAAISFEVWKNDTEHYVKISYRQGPSSDGFNDLIISRINCGGFKGCPLDAVSKAVEKFGTDSPQSLCQTASDGSIFMNELQPLTLVFIATTGILVVVLLVTVIILMRYRTSEIKVEDVRI